MRLRMCAVKVPTPGPYSTSVRARCQSTFFKRRSTRKRELGIREPSILGCWRKFLANSRVSSLRDGLFGTIRMLVVDFDCYYRKQIHDTRLLSVRSAMVFSRLHLSRASLVLLSMLAFTSMLYSNPPAKRQEPAQTVVKANTRLVVVDVVATDNKGTPAPDLTRDDFTLLEDGR